MLPATTDHTAMVPRFSVAGAFLEALAAQDFDGVAVTLADGVHVQGLTPGGLRHWHGPQAVRDQFAVWFGDDSFELLDAVVGEVGTRLHLRWRVRIQRPPEPGWCVIEQQVYADTDASGRIDRLALLCSGFQPEASR